MKYLALITGCVLLTGCATGYQAHTWSGGYKDKELGENHYMFNTMETAQLQLKCLKPFGVNVLQNCVPMVTI
ncbi:hypothetical protein [Pseudoalteromonas sp. SG44-17]|uniref:hypothetical protein n=1 Tax=Pseudoalteromonas sp. SG44-17 TaxID=2760963 RepID=UPI001602F5A5|nr:hypothetical protein [Pseudoalteromonas sp. SG44-17]MBB1410182.1 hypothetical protein [Pseudoalteromonas sp. SG44-17]